MGESGRPRHTQLQGNLETANGGPVLDPRLPKGTARRRLAWTNVEPNRAGLNESERGLWTQRATIAIASGTQNRSATVERNVLPSLDSHPVELRGCYE